MILYSASIFHDPYFLLSVRIDLVIPSCAERLLCCTRNGAYIASADTARRQDEMVI
jgi:hypothetical protein